MTSFAQNKASKISALKSGWQDNATLPQRFAEAMFVQLLAIGVLPDAARGECDATLAEINARLAANIVDINGKLKFPKEFVLNRLRGAD